MADLLFRDTDPDEFRRRIVEELIEALKQVQAQDQPRLVGRDRMAELADISGSTLDRGVADGSIPSIRIGKRRLFEPRKVFDALAGNDKWGHLS